MLNEWKSMLLKLIRGINNESLAGQSFHDYFNISMNLFEIVYGLDDEHRIEHVILFRFSTRLKRIHLYAFILLRIFYLITAHPCMD